MTLARYVVTPRLVKALRINQNTLYSWDTEYDFLHPARDKSLPTKSTRHYLVSDVDDMLAKGARNFAVPPTIGDLTSKRIVLLTSSEVRGMLHLGEQGLIHHVHVGHLRAIKLLWNWRFDKASVDRFLAVKNSETILTRQRTMHILGVAEHKLYRLIREGTLHITADPTNDRRQLVTRPSLAAYLRTVLPDGEDPEGWIDDRLLSLLPLLTVPKAAPLVGGRNTILAMLADGTLRYVHIWPGGEMLVEPGSIQAWLERLTPLTTDQLAHIYGATRQAVAYWFEQGYLACPVHRHDNERELFRPCMIAILGQFLQPKAIVQWYEKRLASTRPMLDENQMAKAIGETRKAVVEKAEKGHLRGIRRPTGVWIFSDSVREKALRQPKGS